MTAARGIVIATSIPPKLSRFDEGVAVGPAYQRLCIESWLSCGFTVVSVNHREEIPDLIGRYPQVNFVATERDLSHLTGRRNPLIADLLLALANRPEPVAGIINSDVLFEPRVEWRQGLPEITPKHVVIAQRYGSGSLRNGALRLFSAGYDCFFFETALAGRLAGKTPAFAMGVPWWDYWLPLALALEGRSIVVCDSPPIMHLTHSTAWQWPLWRYAGLLFAKFLLGHVTTPTPAFAETFAALRHFVAVGEPDRTNEAEFDQRLSDLGWLCVKFLGRNVIRLQHANAPAPSELSRPPAAPDAAFSSLRPQNVFAGFERRVDAGRSMVRATMAAKKGHRDTADSHYRAALAQTPHDADLLAEYGGFALQESEPGILAGFLQAAALHPKPAALVNRVGLELMLASDAEHAGWCFAKAVELDPEFFTGYNNLAFTLRDSEGYDELMQRFARVLARQPGESEGAELYLRARQLRPGAWGTTLPLPEYYAQRGEDALLDAFFGFKPNGFFVDVGAFDGLHLSNSYAFERRGWTGLCIEPAPDYFALCAANRPGSQCRNLACVASGNGPVTFQHEASGLFSGVVADREVVADAFARAEKIFGGFKETTVDSASLNDVLGEHQSEIDFVSIDVEGSELDVLAGFDLERYRPRVLLIEANSEAQRTALDTHLAARGYRYARSILWNHFYVRSEADRERLCAIEVSAKLACPPHPLGADYVSFGYPIPPYVFWPREI